MSALPEKFVKKLKRVAQTIDSEKLLYFFAAVHHDLLPPNRWDVLVSAKGLVPWSIEAIDYVGGLLKKELTSQEFIQIAQVVALPRDNELIASLSSSGEVPEGAVRGLHPLDRPDEAVVIWSASRSMPQAANA